MRAIFIKGFFVFFCFVSVPAFVFGQDASRVFIEPMGWSIGTNFGLSDMWGNVGTLSAVDHYTNGKALDKPCFLGGMFGRYTIHPCLAFRGQINIGALYATDVWNKDKAKAATTTTQANDAYQRYIRNQNALDYMAEGIVLAEFTPFRMIPESKMAHRRGQPFIGAGIGGFYYVPYATVGNGTHWVQTYDLHLEGQGWGAGYPKNYSLWQPCFPIVVGYKWDLGLHFNLGVEWMYRLTLTNYLDGVANNYIDSNQFATHLSPHDAHLAMQIYDKSQYMLNGYGPHNVPGTLRGTPTTYDSYSTITVTFYYKVNSKRREWWRHR